MGNLASTTDEITFIWGAPLLKLAAGAANDIAFSSVTTAGEGE
jgi:hypothetical protein